MPILDVKIWLSEKENVKEGRRGTTETIPATPKESLRKYSKRK